MKIYKLFRDPEWENLRQNGETAGAPVDLSDGYIHFSTAKTLKGTLEKHFAGEDGLWLVLCDSDTLGDALRWEPSRGGLMFPHLYRRLRLDDVIDARPLPLGPEGHNIGELE
ncbi:MAG: DUF952 domain-containing protein [Paracoccus sp. (in: a-proteobacteria)]